LLNRFIIFTLSLKLEMGQPLSFSVPTGNFG